MQLETDVALLGTGVGPLVTAVNLLSQGKSVILLNPDTDFFFEDSELPMDPFFPLHESPIVDLIESQPQQVLESLKPDFPGAIEYWDTRKMGDTGFRDIEAPHVRSRSRLWVRSPQYLQESRYLKQWEKVEELYVEASDKGLHPQVFEGVLAARKFPGFSGAATDDLRGVAIPNICDVDVMRYRNGLLEFVRERVGVDKVICSVLQVQKEKGGLNFRAKGSDSGRTVSLNVRDGALVFWTPRMTHWLRSLTNSKDQQTLDQKAFVESRPKYLQLWEEWTLESRSSLPVNTIGVLEDLLVWADCEGIPDTSDVKRLKVLRAGELSPLEDINHPSSGNNYASEKSFTSLSNLCHGFLQWDNFSVQAMQPRNLFVWGKRPKLPIKMGENVFAVFGSDGPLGAVVKAAKEAGKLFL